MNVQFAAAKEGQMLWTCGYGISPDIAEENLDAAYALLNWYTSLPPQIYAATNLELPHVEPRASSTPCRRGRRGSLARLAVHAGERDPREPAR